MEDLTFGEQVKIVLGRKGMTIKELAETIEKETGKKMFHALFVGERGILKGLCVLCACL